MSKENTVTAKKPVVRRTQEQIVADLEAKAKEARAKLEAKARKEYDAKYAKYLKALDSVLANITAVKTLQSELETEAEQLELNENPHSIGAIDASGNDYDILELSFFATDRDGKELVEDEKVSD